MILTRDVGYRMVARYAAPLCYNFLYLIRLRTRDGKPSLTVFETVYNSQPPVASQSCFCALSCTANAWVS